MTEMVFRLAQLRAEELRRGGKGQALIRAQYPDRERQPRMASHWTNR